MGEAVPTGKLSEAGAKSPSARGAALTGYRRLRGDSLAYTMVLPVVLLVATILGFPLLFNIYLGFTNASAYTGLTNLSWVGLENYLSLFSEPRFQDAFELTIAWTISNLVLQVLVGLALALVLHGLPHRWAKILQPIWLIPWVLPAISIFYVWRLFYNPGVGPIDALLSGLGVIDSPILSDPGLAIYAIVVAAVWKGFPYYMLVFYSALQAVPRDLYDAARVDGAGRTQIFWSIERPEILSVAAPAAVLGSVWIFNSFVPVFALTEGGPGGATTIVGIYVYEEALRRFQFGRSAVAATGLMVLAVVLLTVSQLLRRRAARS